MFKRVFLTFFLTGLTLIAYNQSRNLDFYIITGIQNSPLLNDYRNQISSSVYDSLIVRAAKKPLIEAKSQLLYAPFYKNFGYDNVITDGGNYSGVVSVSQNIFNKKELINKYKAVEIQKSVLNNSTQITKTELKKAITSQYLTAFLSYTDFLFNKSFLELMEKENDIIKQFVKNGIARQTDYLSLVVETQSQAILISQLKNQYKKDLSFLNQLCGLNDSLWYELSDPEFGIKGTAEIAGSPVYIQYKTDSIRIENEKMAVDIRYKPRVSWFADAGFLTSNPWNFYRHFGYSAGLSLNVPLYDGKQKGIEKQKLEFNERSRQAYQNTYYKQYYQQIRQFNEELRNLKDMSVRFNEQLKTSDQLLKALKDQLESGIIQITEYINALKNFKTINRNINLLNMQRLQVINDMNFLLTQ
jgi:outer membrane protein TolC